MKLLAAIQDPQKPEARVRGPESQTAERTDGASGQAFDGILTKVENKDAQTLPKTPSSNVDVSKRADPARKAATTALDRESSGAMTDLLGDGLEPSRQGSRQLGSASADGNDGAVDKLLERFKSTQEDKGTDTKADANTQVINQLFSPTVVVNLRTEATAVDGREAAETPGGVKSAAHQTPELARAAERTGSEATPPEGAVVLDIKVSAHLAPGKGDDARPAPPDEDHLQPGQSLDGFAPSIVASDDAGSSRHDDRPPGDGKSDAVVQKQVEVPAGTASTPFSSLVPIRDIATAVSELASRAASTAVSEAPKSVNAAPAHTVILQMSPADLGTVEIRLHLSGDVLDLQLTISEQRTLGLVTRERDTLAKALEDHRYELNSLVIQDGSAAPSSGGTHVAKHETSGDAQADRRSGGNDGAGAQAGGDGRRNQTSGRSSRGDHRPRSDVPPRPRVGDGRSLLI